jgi:hypothetical protein
VRQGRRPPGELYLRGAHQRLLIPGVHAGKGRVAGNEALLHDRRAPGETEDVVCSNPDLVQPSQELGAGGVVADNSEQRDLGTQGGKVCRHVGRTPRRGLFADVRDDRGGGVGGEALRPPSLEDVQHHVAYNEAPASLEAAHERGETRLSLVVFLTVHRPWPRCSESL